METKDRLLGSQNKGGQRHAVHSKRTPQHIDSGRSNGQRRQQSPYTARSTPKKHNDFKPFEPYYTLEQVSEGLKRGTLYQGAIRINQRSYEDAYVDSPDGYGDIHIYGMHDRNQSLHGDEVIVQLLPKEKWKVNIDEFKAEQNRKTIVNETYHLNNLTLTEHATKKHILQCNEEAPSSDDVKRKLFSDSPTEGVVIPDRFYEKFGKVVYIVEKKHSRAAAGYIKPPSSQRAPDALFSPTDSRIPRIYIPLADCPPSFQQRPGDFANTIFIARITEWNPNSRLPKGCLQRSVGEAGQIEPETEAILIEYGVDYSEFSDEILACLPQDEKWEIPEEEISRRKDLRKECIFTIDPATARDLDDALSCRPTKEGNFEIGVHIADVSYFVPEGSALDEKAGERATSVYLVQKVIPMLPRLLCEKLCSLNPYEDRLAFSFIWNLSPDGEIIDEWCGRTVIRSCVKLSYNHAQDMIENPKKDFEENTFPEVTNQFNIYDVKNCTLNLHKVAAKLRKKRFDDGALRLDQVKLSFVLDHETGMPSGYSVYQQRDSNKLVEEFMLLANMAAAHRIYKHFPEQALLRRHNSPKEKMIDNVVDICNEMGLDIDASSAGTLQESIQRYVGEDTFSRSRTQILVNLCSKPMQLATYFCTGLVQDEHAYRHYALNVALYTHFTSPIRRYADIIVHRLLAATVKSADPPSKEMLQVEQQAKRCNERKIAAKKVQELSSDMFLAIFIKECGPLEEDGMVMAVLDQSVDILVLSIGVVKRAYCNAVPLKSAKFSKHGKRPQLDLVWGEDDKFPIAAKQTLTVFTQVKVILKGIDGQLKYCAILKRPDME